jgi:MFS family permease
LRVILSASIGSALEWYDFFLYGTAAALVFGELFFPKSDPIVGTLLSFLTFGVGFVVRPLGGILFGIMGDRYGRKPVLVATLLMIGIGTTAIGFLPTYAQIGYWAPVLVPVENQIRTYWWCSPPRIGRQRICPARSTARESGASFSKDRCVRAPL